MKNRDQFLANEPALSDEGSYEKKNELLERIRNEIGVEVEIVSGVPIFMVETDKKDGDISKIVHFFGKHTVFRIINGQFVDDAVKFGTDKAHVDEHDFRRVARGAGYDIWGVEKEALKQGLKKSDVFCGTPHEMFAKEGGFRSAGLGLPDDRAAILIYDGEKLQEVKGSEELGGLSDGYAFKDTKKKREALLGVIKFRESLSEFERELQALELVDDRVALLEKEVFQNLNTPNDLKKAPYLALNIISLLHRESLENTSNPSEISTGRINKLKTIADRLKYEIEMIGIVENMARHVALTREAFATRNEQKMELMRSWPDFVIETTQGYLRERELDQKYVGALTRVIEEAKKCKRELSL